VDLQPRGSQVALNPRADSRGATLESPSAEALRGTRTDTGDLPRAEHATRRALALTLLYLVVVAVGIAHHEMWRDELQAWMIARDSGSLAELLLVNLREEGHPALWHSLLFLITRFTRDPVAMQVLHAALATAAVFLLARFSPFSWAQKGLIAFGYFLVYEYAVVSRSYVLAVLTVFAFCALYPHRHRRRWPLALTLLLLANTTVYGSLLALSLLAMLVVERHGGEAASPNASARLGVLALVSGVSVIVAFNLWLTGGVGTAMGALGQESAAGESIGAMVGRVWKAYFPIPDVTTFDSWGTNLFFGNRVLEAIAAVLSVAILAGGVLLFFDKPLVVFLYLFGTAALLSTNLFLHFGSLRHHGHLFLLFLAGLWLAALPSRSAPVSERIAAWRARCNTPFVASVLVAQLLGGVIMWTHDVRHPFSPARSAAESIRVAGLHDLPLWGHSAPVASPVGAYLDRKILYPAQGTDVPQGFIWWRRRPRRISPENLARMVEEAAHAEGELVLIWSRPFRAEVPGLDVQLITHLPPGIEGTEEYFLYRVRRQAAR
jgi:hypothetical protein